MTIYHEQLDRIVQTETAHFCDTEQALQISRGATGRPRDDARLHARLTNCGIASALVQHNLQHYHNITTNRLFGEAPLAPRTRFSRKFGHVLLRTDDVLIDPTYGQLFSYVGIDASTPAGKDFAYPDTLSLAVDVNNPDATLEPLVDSLHEAAQSKLAAQDTYAPLRDQGRQALQAVVYDIYNPDNYIPYEVESLHPSFDYVQALKQISDQLRSN